MKLGKSFKIGYIDDDGRFLPLAFSQSASIDRKTSSTEVSSPLTGGWEERRPKRNSWSMQHEGLLGSNTAVYKYKGKTYDFWALMKKLWLDKYIFTARWQEVLASGLPGDMVQGQCFIDDMKQVASEKALTKVSVNLTGTGELRDLSAEDLTGAFAYSIQGHTMTLYTITRPIASFSVHAGTTAVGVWDETATGRTQTFTDDAITASSVITAWKGEGAAATEQTGVVFTDCTTLHVVLLQTDERDSMQQLHRYVQPLWWGGLSMGDMTLKRGTDTVAEFATAGLTGSAPRVEINPGTDITLDNYTWTLVTDAPQTIHCTDRTTSLQRTLLVAQQQSNRTELPYIVYVEPDLFSCPNTIWGNDDNGNTAFSVNEPSLARMIPSAALLPDAQHLHWQLTGLGADDGGPYTVQRELVTDTAQHDVFYAYDATTQKLRIWCQDEVLMTILIADDVDIHSGLLYDTDGQGNRVPLTLTGVASFTTLTTAWGNYRFNDVSNIEMVMLAQSRPIPLSLIMNVVNLDDIILLGPDTVELARIPKLSTPGVPVASVPDIVEVRPRTAQMETGAAQSLTVSEYERNITVSSASEKTQNNQWQVTARLTIDGTSTPAELPGEVRIKWPGIPDSIAIPAGYTETTVLLNFDPSWITPEATMDYWADNAFFITTGSTVDTTPANWKAYKLGTLNGKDLYDIQYVPTNGYVLTLISDSFTGGDAFIAAGEGIIASHLMRVNAGDTPTMQVRKAADTISAPATVTFTGTQIVTDQPVVLRYFWAYDDNDRLVAKLTDSNKYCITSRRTNIGEELPYMRVRDRSQSGTVPIYNPAYIYNLKPNRTWTDVVVRTDFPEDMNDRPSVGIVEFTYNNDWGTNIISVGDNLPGLEIYPYWSHDQLPKA